MQATLASDTEVLTIRGRLGDPRLTADMITETHAIEHGHFELLGAAHSDAFLRFSRIAERSQALEQTAAWLLPTVAAWLPEVVVAPSTAGVGLGWTLATRLGLPLSLAVVGADGRASSLHADDSVLGKRALLVNDVVTTGAGMTALASTVRAASGEVAGAAWFLTRTNLDAEASLGVPCAYVADLPLPQWAATACPLCDAALPLTRAIEIN
jgi:orotate phosphoribosyltransferase